MSDGEPSDDTAAAEATAQLVLSAQTPEDFTYEYDVAVDDTESDLLTTAIEALGTLDIRTALENVGAARQVRGTYLILLQQVAQDPQHPAAESVPDLERYGRSMDEVSDLLQRTLMAFDHYQRWNPQEALRVLNEFSYELPTARHLSDGELNILATQVMTATESLAGIIRMAARDYVGARAAYERSAQTARNALAEFESRQAEGDDLQDLISGFTLQLKTSECGSLTAQYMQMIGIGDFIGANGAAVAAAAASEEAADTAAEELPSIAALLRASAFEKLANAEQAVATHYLEDGRLDEIEPIITKVNSHFQNASLQYIDSGLPIANLLQERMLHESNEWTAMFRRQASRERSHLARIQQLESELADISTGVRGALSSAGVTVNTATEMVTSVRQQVDATTNIEQNVRQLLDDLPQALAATNMSADERAAIGAQVAELNALPAGDPGFFSQVRAFAKTLAAKVRSAAETAAPVVAILDKLSIL